MKKITLPNWVIMKSTRPFAQHFLKHYMKMSFSIFNHPISGIRSKVQAGHLPTYRLIVLLTATTRKDDDGNPDDVPYYL